MPQSFRVKIYARDQNDVERLVCDPQIITENADCKVLIPPGLENAYLRLPIRVHIDKVN